MGLASSSTYRIASKQVLAKMDELAKDPARWEKLAKWVKTDLANDE